MPYVNIGVKPVYNGRPLFHILCNLRNHGQGRIVYSTLEHLDFPNELSFYRILKAQPEMDNNTKEGRVVAERVFRGLRYKHPVILSDKASLPDFRLVAKEDEEQFCQWSQIQDYDPSVHAPLKPKYFTCPPLLREYFARVKGKADINLQLPAFQVYEGDTRVEDRCEDISLRPFISDDFATYDQISVEDIPDSWRLERMKIPVGQKHWHGFVEGQGWEEQKERDDEERKNIEQREQLGIPLRPS